MKPNYLEMQQLLAPISTLWSLGGFARILVPALLNIGEGLHQLQTTIHIMAKSKDSYQSPIKSQMFTKSMCFGDIRLSRQTRSLKTTKV